MNDCSNCGCRFSYDACMAKMKTTKCPEELLYHKYKCSKCGKEYENTGLVKDLCLQCWFKSKNERHVFEPYWDAAPYCSVCGRHETDSCHIKGVVDV